MTNDKFRAYIFPKVDIGGDVRTRVFASTLGAQMAKTSSGVGYLIEGEKKIVHTGNILSKIFGRTNYKDGKAFRKDVKDNLLHLEGYLLEKEVESFANERGLIPTRLLLDNPQSLKI